MKIRNTQRRCIGCNKVVSKKKPYCFNCLNELKDKAGEEE